jgi:hypothetical protein
VCHDDWVSDNFEKLIDELKGAVAGASSLSQEDRDRQRAQRRRYLT